MGKTKPEGPTCPVARALDLFGDRWSLLIVREAFERPRRFSEFERRLGLAKNILAARLKSMVDHGVLIVAPASDGSAYHEYALTDKGSRLFPAIVAIGQWGADFLYSPDEPQTILLDARDGRAVASVKVTSGDGRDLMAADIITIVR